MIVVHIRESNAKPVQRSDGFFWRQGSTAQKLRREEIRDFFIEKAGTGIKRIRDEVREQGCPEP